MRIGFCTEDQSNYVGGPNVWLLRLLPFLRSQDLEPVVYCFNSPKDGSTALALKEEGIPVEHAPTFNGLQEASEWIVGRANRDELGAFVPNFTLPAYYASRWLRESGIRTVAVIHSDDSYHRGIIRQFISGYSQFRVSDVACVSQFLVQDVKLHAGPETGVHYLPYGAPLTRKRTSSPGGKLRVAYVGRFVNEQKRFGTVVRACAMASRVMPDVEFTFIGKGDDAYELDPFLDSHHGPGLRLRGRLDSQQILKELAGYHAIILLSDYEGLPIALMEAMAVGVVPICLQGRSGIGELVQDSVNGFIIRDRADEFVNALSKLRNPTLWKSLSANARATISRSYSHEACSARWASLFQSMEAGVSVSFPVAPVMDFFPGVPSEHIHYDFLSRAIQVTPPRPLVAAAAAEEIPGQTATTPAPVSSPQASFLPASIAGDSYFRERLQPLPGDTMYLHLSDLRKTVDWVATTDSVRILDYGCGCSPYQSLFPNATYERADYVASEGILYTIGQHGEVDAEPESYDLILCTQVAEHLENPIEVFRELNRLLKPEGKVFVTTHGMFGDHPCPQDFQRWTAEGLERDLKRAGFHSVQCSKTTSGPRALGFFLELHLKSMLTESNRALNILLRSLQYVIRRYRSGFHKYLDNHFKEHRVREVHPVEFIPYIGLSATARK